MPLSGDYAPSTSEWARLQAETYEATGGTEGGELRGRPVIVLTSVGARSGMLRKTALMRVEHDGLYAVAAPRSIRSGTGTWSRVPMSSCRTAR
jgi:F420H(2)-dependent quinone reductase